MYRETIWSEGDVRIVLMDSMSQAEEADAGAIVVAGSNGGQESGRVGAAARCGFVLLNDAGVGKDAAGIAALDILDQTGIPAATVSHDSAEISSGRDMWESGVLSHVNATAARLGLAVADEAQPALLQVARQLTTAATEQTDVVA